MDWHDIETELKQRPLPQGSDKDAFWAEFRRRSADLPRDQRAPEPIGIGRWLVLAVAAVAVLAGTAVLVPDREDPAMQIASTEVKSVDVVASHAGVIIMTAEADGTNDGATVLWIADMDLGASEGN